MSTAVTFRMGVQTDGLANVARETIIFTMPDWPTEIITDQDLRYRELLAEEAEARVRFWSSEMAKAEMAALVKSDCPRPEWRLAKPIRRDRQRVFRWD